MMTRTFLSNGALVTKTPFPITPAYSTSWFPSMPPMSGGWNAAYDGIYSSQLWVYVVVNKLAKAAARLPLPVYRRTADNGRNRDSSHEMAQLLDRPGDGLSGFDLWVWTSSVLDIYGHAFWFKQRRRGRIVALVPMHPASMTHNDDGSWTFDNGSKVRSNIPPADLIHFKSFHPKKFDAGLSPLEPLRATLENEWNARTATSSFWARGARPGMALKHPANLSAQAQDRLKIQMDSLHAGAGNTGSTIILEEGMTPETMTLTAEEAQYIDTRRLNREEVCAAYDVPPPVVHILDRATFSNITEQMRSMYRDTMAPRLRHFEATLELDLRRIEWPNDDVYAEFLMDEVLRGDFEARQDALAKASHMTIAEKRAVENLPHLPGTDRLFLNTATLPLDAIDAQAAAIVAGTAAAAATADKPPPPPAVVRSIFGRLAWQTSLDDVDGLALIKDLDDDHAGLVLLALHSERKTDGTVAGLRTRIEHAITD